VLVLLWTTPADNCAVCARSELSVPCRGARPRGRPSRSLPPPGSVWCAWTRPGPSGSSRAATSRAVRSARNACWVGGSCAPPAARPSPAWWTPARARLRSWSLALRSRCGCLCLGVRRAPGKLPPPPNSRCNAAHPRPCPPPTPFLSISPAPFGTVRCALPLLNLAVCA
jgi:hypothetical protein